MCSSGNGLGDSSLIILLKKTAPTFFQVFAGVRKEEDAERLKRDVKTFKSYGNDLDKRLHPIILDVTDKNTIDLAFTLVSSFLEEKSLVSADILLCRCLVHCFRNTCFCNANV